MVPTPQRLNPFVIRHVPRTKQYVPQRRGNTKVAVGVVVMDMMIGRPPSGQRLAKMGMVDDEVAQHFARSIGIMA